MPPKLKPPGLGLNETVPELKNLKTLRRPKNGNEENLPPKTAARYSEHDWAAIQAHLNTVGIERKLYGYTIKEQFLLCLMVARKMVSMATVKQNMRQNHARLEANEPKPLRVFGAFDFALGCPSVHLDSIWYTISRKGAHVHSLRQSQSRVRVSDRHVQKCGDQGEAGQAGRGWLPRELERQRTAWMNAARTQHSRLDYTRAPSHRGLIPCYRVMHLFWEKSYHISFVEGANRTEPEMALAFPSRKGIILFGSRTDIPNISYQQGVLRAVPAKLPGYFSSTHTITEPLARARNVLSVMFSGELSALTSLTESRGSSTHPSRQNSGSPYGQRSSSGSLPRPGNGSSGGSLPPQGVTTSPSFAHPNPNQTLLQNVQSPLSYSSLHQSNSHTPSFAGSPDMLHPMMNVPNPRLPSSQSHHVMNIPHPRPSSAQSPLRPSSAQSHHSMNIAYSRPSSAQSHHTPLQPPPRNQSPASSISSHYSPSHSYQSAHQSAHSGPVFPTLDRPASRNDGLPTPPWQGRGSESFRERGQEEIEEINGLYSSNGDGHYAENVFPQAPIIPIGQQAPTTVDGVTTNWNQPILNPASWLHQARHTAAYGVPTYSTWSPPNTNPGSQYRQQTPANYQQDVPVNYARHVQGVPLTTNAQYQYPPQNIANAPQDTPTSTPDKTPVKEEEPVDPLDDILLRISQLKTTYGKVANRRVTRREGNVVTIPPLQGVCIEEKGVRKRNGR
ncbi:hypothetical protein DFP72DRAFT_839326 [Ephemerocybe angulata]|uniref:Uncharacterized protein n=1 Tax=Ephemerocybe angulata TaxID=980116 RepID=A0A8H6IJQ5_9AGAR|nr:hypothetical protein DFP72DRAFT_839326 [Tulosesus angulatus]